MTKPEYTPSGGYQLVIPMDITEMIPADDSVYNQLIYYQNYEKYI